MPKQALVIGGTGFLGAAIVRELRAAGWELTTLARGRQGNPFHDVSLIVADRSQPGALAQAIRGRDFDLVVDCAGFQEPDAAAAMEAFTGRIGLYVFISTDFVYAAAPDARFPVREDAPKNPELPYAAGKLACEAALGHAWETQRFPSV
ncbi:MAG: NAD-dependent epimerase/dehydratase family protein, partial [Armatimonadota bacterium]|nr:NAD-dependent epimerase/dehydratase family protein [Armatimonadota bacterium]